jgi:hypothetical protein
VGPATLISLLILVVVASVVLKDVARMRQAAAPAPRPEDTPLVPPYANDPVIQAVQSDLRSLGTFIGAVAGQGVGGVVGRGAGTGISAAETEFARGLASQPAALDTEVLEFIRRSNAAARTGAIVTTEHGATIGGTVLGALPISVGSAVERAGVLAKQAAEAEPNRLPDHPLYTVPVLGGIYRWSDALFGGRP